MTTHSNRSKNRQFDSVTVRYFSDGRRAYWTETFVDGPQSTAALTYSANRYATFHGLDCDGRQVHGPCSTPLKYRDPRRYFLQRPGFATAMDFKIVDSLDRLIPASPG